MSNLDFFTQLGHEGDVIPLKPFWTVNIKDDASLLKWLNEAVDCGKREQENRVLRQQTNLAAYRGIHYKVQDSRRSENSTEAVKTTTIPRLVINQIYDLVESDVAKITQFRPAISVDASDDDEYSDRRDAEIVKEIIDAKWEQVDIDPLIERFERRKNLLGEDFIWIKWNPNIGDLHPEYKTLLKDGESTPRIPLTGEDGKQIIGENGEPLYIEKPVRIGDLEYKLIFSWDVFTDVVKSYDESDWVIVRCIEHVDNVKAEHPDKASKIKPNQETAFFNHESLQYEMAPDKVEVYYLYHRTTDQLGNGRYIKFTKDVVLDNKENDYKRNDMADIPLIRETDIDIPGMARGVSNLENIRPMQNVYNNITQMILRNQIMTSHPKWMVPDGSVKVESLGNDATIVKYRGPQPPVLAQSNPTPKELFEFRQNMKDEMGQIYGVYKVSRGEAPPGIKAFVALQFMDEQENQRSNTKVLKHNAAIRELADKTRAYAGCFYDDDDGRLQKLLGKTRALGLKNFKMKDLSKPYVVKVQNMSALPLTKSARIQAIFDYTEKFPDLMPREQLVDILELGSSKKFHNYVTVNVRAAEAENDDILQMGSTEEPKDWEDHLVHYRIHMKLLAEKGTKDMMPKKNFEALKDHIMATEMLLADSASKNPDVLMKTKAEFPNFPVFFKSADITMMSLLASGPQIAGAGVPNNLPPNAMPEATGLSMPAGAENLERTANPSSMASQNIAAANTGEI